jgi:hypothetical protein
MGEVTVGIGGFSGGGEFDKNTSELSPKFGFALGVSAQTRRLFRPRGEERGQRPRVLRHSRDEPWSRARRRRSQ